MTSDLNDHKILRRRRTRQGWIDIIEEKADKPEPVDDWERHWPPGWGPRPYTCGCAGCWFENGWPRCGSIPVWPGRALTYELGNRVVGELLGSRRPRRTAVAA